VLPWPILPAAAIVVTTRLPSQAKTSPSPPTRPASGARRSRVISTTSAPSTNPQAALEKWLTEKDYLLAGKKSPRRGEFAEPILEDLVNKFLTTKKNLNRSRWTLQAYQEACKRVIDAFGRDRRLTDIGPADFEALRAKWSKTWGLVQLDAEINHTKVIFNYAYKNGMVDKPIRVGEGFVRPSKKELRLNRHNRDPRLFEADELRRIIDAAEQPLKAMFLLAINFGFGNNDIGQLPKGALDLAGGWLNYPRPKTGIMRRVPLWPETIAVLTDWLARRPKPKTDDVAQLVFLTFRGNGWCADLHDRPITKETRKLLDRLGVNGHRSFYTVRHVFETIGGESRDQVAVDAIMGHDNGSMSNVYREWISDERLHAVTDHVLAWLFRSATAAKATEEGGAR
jgi:integrase